jgi:hypothetical protein
LNRANVSLSAIKEIYANVRNDSSETNWTWISYESENKTKFELVGKGGGGLYELKGKLDDNFINLGYLRIQTGDELSKRVNCVLIR